MDNTPSKKLLTSVAPFVGAWIEIPGMKVKFKWQYQSLRSSERGLKYSKMGGEKRLSLSLRSSERGLKYKRLNDHRVNKGRSVRRSVD